MQTKLQTIAPFLILSLLSAVVVGSMVISFVSANSVITQKLQTNGQPAEVAQLRIYPEDVSRINVGQTFTVTLAVYGLDGNDLYGFDVEFAWDTLALQYVSHEAKVPVETYPEGVLEQPVVEVENQLDASSGTYWLAYASVLPAEPCNKNGVIFTMTFVLLEPTDKPYSVNNVVLANKNGDPIPMEVYQTPEIPMPVVSDKLQALRQLAAMEWLKWWIRQSWQQG